MNKGLKGLFVFLLVVSLIGFSFAQDFQENDVSEGASVSEEVFADEFDEFSEDEEISFESSEEVDSLIKEAEEFNEELSVGPGITPDSSFYFFEDKILSNFRSDLENREKKIAEMRVLAEQCGQGNQEACENMEKSFEKYQEYASRFGKEVSPDERDEAIRSSEAIRGVAIREIAQNVPAGEKDEFVREIILEEKGISTAAEVSAKIKELCEQLSKLDPLEYSRVCGSKDDSPKWHIKLDKDLTSEQKKDAEIFIKVMTQCFEDASQCECNKIPVKSFAEQCSEVAPLYVQCQQGDEEMCELADELSENMEDLLPDYLQKIMADLEDEFEGGRFENFAPPECVEAGANSQKECAKIMIQTHAPPECKQALLDANVQSEREARTICEKIMFEQNAPQECIDAGLTNQKECGKLMFEQNAPQECIDAGLTGENRNDPRECQKLMESFQGEFGEGPNRGPGEGFNIDCRRIENPEERLKCFDGAVSFAHEERQEFGNFEERFRQDLEATNQCAESCLREGKAWDFRDGQCSCREGPSFDDSRFRSEEEFRDGEYRFREEFRDGENRFREEFRGDFEDGRFIPPEGFQPPEGFIPPEEFDNSGEGSFSSGSGEDGNFKEDNSGPSESSGSSGEENSNEESAPVTGGVISNNRFLGYWFKWF